MKCATLTIITRSVEETRALGEKLGSVLTSGIMIRLIGDLGTGKTAFVQGLAKGLEVSEKYYITSPTYTLINEYPGRLPLFHADLYRLENQEDFETIDLFDCKREDVVFAVEWADKVDQREFSECLGLHLHFVDDHTREIVINAGTAAAEAVLQQLEKHLKESKWG
jgi:tRNA threonylcarbamoyladenosine biosynthesis protein TsaE